MTDPALLGLGALADAIRTRRVSSREATEALIARAKRWNPHVNAVHKLDEEAALSLADAADRAEPQGPLHGVPLLHKDMFYEAGKVSECGSRLRAGWVAPETATVLERLSAAGAFRLGALHMVEFAYGVTGHNDWLGPARNPWRVERITGGSSSGSGVAVAAELTPASLGSDTGGSVRLPAHFCGVTGLKTSFGLVSRAGCMPLSTSLDTIGPLARSAADLRLIAPLIAGPDPRDPSTGPHWRAETRAAAEMTIGVSSGFYDQDLHPDVARAFDAAIATFRTLGIRVVPVALPDQAAIAAAALIVLGAEAASLHRQGLASRAELYGRQTRTRLQTGFGYTAVEYLDAMRARGPALAAMLAAMAQCDAVIAPTARFPAPTIAETDAVGGAANAMIAAVSAFMRAVNYLGLPALALPAGLSGEGLPIGVQLIGKPFGDDALLVLGEAFQKATDHHLRRPPEPA